MVFKTAAGAVIAGIHLFLPCFISDHTGFATGQSTERKLPGGGDSGMSMGTVAGTSG